MNNTPSSTRIPINVFWFRRDLRFYDNVGLAAALNTSKETDNSKGIATLPLFIFDTEILKSLPVDDRRINFIYQTLVNLEKKLRTEVKSGFYIAHGTPLKVFKTLIHTYLIKAVFTNEDYEPYARKRDQEIANLLGQEGIEFHSYKDQVIFAPSEVLKNEGVPYTVYTPYKNKWLSQFRPALKSLTKPAPSHELLTGMVDTKKISLPSFPSLKDLGFTTVKLQIEPLHFNRIRNFDAVRNFPGKDECTYAGVYLRFGLVSVRDLVVRGNKENDVFLSELVWREFFMQILFYYPQVVKENFRAKYNAIKWRNNQIEFKRWCAGETGFPIVDAGMHQLNNTGYMSNRVRLIVANFLCKDLLIDWRWGELYFAKKLLDYDLSANNGNWQWCAGTGCDAAPYFRIFNPQNQTEKFDPELIYVKRWLPHYGTSQYPAPMVDHNAARKRALEAYAMTNMAK